MAFTPGKNGKDGRFGLAHDKTSWEHNHE